jgi:hypothetical protein
MPRVAIYVDCVDSMTLLRFESSCQGPLCFLLSAVCAYMGALIYFLMVFMSVSEFSEF